MKVKAPCIVRFNGVIETYMPQRSIFTDQELEAALSGRPETVSGWKDKKDELFVNGNAAEEGLPDNEWSKQICGRTLQGDILIVPRTMLKGAPEPEPEPEPEPDDEDAKTSKKKKK